MHTHITRTAVFGLTILVAVSCKAEQSSERPGQPEAIANKPAPPTTSKSAARGLFIPPTNAGALALRHMRLQIANFERMSKMRGLMLSQYRGYVDWLSLRARFLGRLSDYDVMLQVAARAVREFPDKPEAYLLRAQVNSGLHLFAKAKTDLAKAVALSLSPDKADKMRATLLAATGELDQALIIRQRLAKKRPTLYSLGDVATLQAELGNEERAEQLFVRALKIYRDRSPFAVAWLLFQRGLTKERAGRTGDARDSYRLAYGRLRAAPLTGHLAGAEAATGNDAEAIKLLRDLVKTTDDPDYLGQLGELLHKRGDSEAANLLARARKGYIELARRHPLAFGDHAARFWLGPGKDPARALELAKINVANRATDEAFQLLLDASHAAKAPATEQCKHAQQAQERRHASAYLLFAVARAYRTCDRDKAAVTVLALAAKAKRKR